MILRKWDALPDYMKNDEVRKYYEVLKKKKLQLCLKRLFDILLSLILIVILLPIFVTVSIVIKLDSKGRVFFLQDRVTQYGRTFKICKFRTMIDTIDKDGLQVTVSEDSRITKCGKILRKYRIDELPQLFNILCGDMSFVGPRPEVEKYVKCCGNEMIATLLVPAGVTSMTSIAFRNEAQLLQNVPNVEYAYIMNILPTKIKMNLDYIKDMSVFYDIKVMFVTVLTIFLSRDKV